MKRLRGRGPAPVAGFAARALAHAPFGSTWATTTTALPTASSSRGTTVRLLLL